MGNNSLARCGFLAAAFLLVFEVRATTFRIDIDTSALVPATCPSHLES